MKTKLILLLLCLSWCITSFAESFTDGNFKFNTLSDDECEVTGTTLTSGALNIPATATYNGKTLKVTSIGTSAFEGCSDFTGSLTLPGGLTSIGPLAFFRCSSLTGKLKLPEGLTSIGARAFSGCSGFTGSLTLPVGLTSIETGTFGNCSGFTGVLILPEGLKSIGESAFFGCSGFTGSLIIPSGVTSIGIQAFEGCSGFTGELKLPEGLTSIGLEAFFRCRFTGSLTLPEGLTSIDWHAFSYCSGFTGSLIIPNSVTSIGNYAFYGCSGFNGSLTLPEGLTSLDRATFYGCSGFTGELKLPEGLTNIESGAFNGCSGFTELYLPTSLKEIGVQAFLNTTFNLITCVATTPPVLGKEYGGLYETFTSLNYGRPLYVPAESVSLYKSATEWKNFKNINPIGQEVDSIALNKSEITIAVGDTTFLAVTVLPEDAVVKTVSWKSSNESIATVDATGKVTAIAVGNATIAATSANGLTATCAVAVTAKPSGIEGIDAASKDVRVEGNSIIAPEGSEVYDFSGRKVRATELRRGVYIVRVPGGKAVKVEI